jgi:ribosomal protein S18 acetylase RimI-like enzyme
VEGFAGRVQDYLLHAAQRGREAIAVPPFVVTVDPSTDLRYLNYAIPAQRDAAASAAAALDALRAEMRERGRLPRLEFVREAAEGLDSMLLAGGFELESSLPLMICSRDELTAAPAVEGLTVEVLTPSSPDELLTGVSAAQEDAFGDSSGGTNPDRQRKRLAAGGISVAAVVDGQVVGGAAATVVSDGLSEVAGIGVREAFRNRGIAAALTEAAAREAFAKGADLALLTPGHDEAQRIYARAGFAGRLTMLAFAGPASP